MHDLPQECVELPHSRRHSVTLTGAGSGYSTFRPVEPDIHTRILSLALSCSSEALPRKAYVYSPEALFGTGFNSGRPVTKILHQVHSNLDRDTATQQDDPLLLTKRRRFLNLHRQSTTGLGMESKPSIASPHGDRLPRKKFTRPVSHNANDNGNLVTSSSLLGTEAASEHVTLTVDTAAHNKLLNSAQPEVPTRQKHAFKFPRLEIRRPLSFSSRPRVPQPHSSFKAAILSPSLRSVRPKTSRSRHPLLKPSVSAMNLVDLGLPAQPVLTSPSDIFGSGHTESSGSGKIGSIAPSISKPTVTHPAVYVHNLAMTPSMESLLRFLTQSSGSDIASSNPLPVSLSPSTTVGDGSAWDCQAVAEVPTVFPVRFQTTQNVDPAMEPDVPKMPDNATVYKPSTTVSPQPTIMVGVYKAAQGGIKSPSAGGKQWASTGYRRMDAGSFIEAAKRAGECLTGGLSGSEISVTTMATNDPTSVKSEDEPRSHEKKPEGSESKRGPAVLDDTTADDIILVDQPAFAKQASGSNNGASSLKPASPLSYNQSYTPSVMPMITGAVTRGDQDNRSYEKLVQQNADPFGTYETVFLSQSDERLDELERITVKRRSGSKIFPSRKAADTWKSSIERFSRKVRSRSSRSSLNNSFSNEKVAPKSSIHELSLQATIAFATTNQNTQTLPERHRHRTVHWLKGILPSHEPSTPQFAALPACTNHDSNSNKEPNNPRNALTENTVKDGTAEKAQTENPEAFTRTRDDLENLVNEALYIAHQAADKDDGRYQSISNSAFVDVQQSAPIRDGETYRKCAQSTMATRLRLRPSASDVPSSLDSIRETGSGTSSNWSWYRREQYSGHYHDGRRVASREPREEVTVQSGRLFDTRPVTNSAMKTSAARRRLQQQPVPNVDFPDCTTTIRSSRKASVTVEPPGLIRINPMINRRSSSAGSKSPSLGPPKPSESRLANAESKFASSISNLALGRDKHPPSGDHKSQSPMIMFPKSASRSKQFEVEDEIGGKYTRSAKDQLPNKGKILNFIKRHNQLPIQTRQSSLSTRKIHHYNADSRIGVSAEGTGLLPTGSRKRRANPSLDGPEDADDEGSSEIEFVKFVMSSGNIKETRSARTANRSGDGGEAYEMQFLRERNGPSRHISGRSLPEQPKSLCSRGRPLVNIDVRFNLSRSRRRQPVALDWSTARDGFWITVACVSTGLIGVYAGLVPSIQYYIADFHHYAMLGNVLFYVGLALPTAVVWPWSLLHGRKLYVLGTIALAMPLLLSQALAVNAQRSPYVATYRVGLILPRAFMGLTLGFANMNSMSILADLFGASLQSSKPHQELACSNDAGRHGCGMGVWLGMWTWCYIGPIGMGFLIGACIINTQSHNWGLNVCVTVITGVLLLNIITPEVRRSEYGRSVTEAQTINKG